MTQQDPFEQLSRALEVAPSPDFAARVRQQVAGQPARGAWWSVRHLVAAAAVVSVAVVQVARWAGPARPVVDHGAPPKAAAIAPSVTVSPSVVRVQPRPPLARALPAESAFAETLVPDDQRLALERLLGAIRAGRATVPAVLEDEVVDEDGRRWPRALLIEPLKLEPLIK